MKSWRHMNLFQYKAYLHARLPRVACPSHGIHTAKVPWAREGSGFTLLFEAFAMSLISGASLTITSTRLSRSRIFRMSPPSASMKRPENGATTTSPPLSLSRVKAPSS
ncbi:helix-turn-helix domain-containing protein [Aminirod propionatiphilus]|uniref:helix-turn-helix domain-containing protein n=1 Tax=Aminirod propionatiphilus TaxID=3415223 RepID=UPI003BFA7486